MMHTRYLHMRLSIAFSVAIILAAFALPALALDSEFIGADEIVPGMRGYALAQFYGDAIERFDVEIVSVYGKRHPAEGYFRRFVAVVDGGPLKISRGISTGFSGAPVYFDGRLAGAIESTPAYSAKNYVTIIAIEEMLTLFDSPSFKRREVSGEDSTEESNAVESTELSQAIIVEGETINRIAVAGSLSELEHFRSEKGTLAMVRCGGRIIVSVPSTGEVYLYDETTSASAHEDVDKGNGSGAAFNIVPLIGPGGEGYPSLQTTPPFSYEYYPIGGAPAFAPFTPGAMISIPLVRGDMDAYLNGTLTYIAPDGRFLAFAHEIDGGRGGVRLPIARAHVYTTHTALEENWSLIRTGPVVATLYEDRQMGGAGAVVPYEDFCPVHVSMVSADSHTQDESDIEVVMSPSHFHTWLVTGLNFQLERTADQWGKGTLHYVLRIGLAGRDEPLTFEDTVYHPSDWRAPLAGVVQRIAERLTLSELGEFVPRWVDVECTYVKAERTARIADTEFGLLVDDEFEPFEGQDGVSNNAKKKLAPGAAFGVKFNVVMPDGRIQDAYIETVIPDDFPEGPARIQVRGGRTRMPDDRGMTPQLMGVYAMQMDALVRYYKPPVAMSRDELYAEISETEAGGAVILEIVAADEEKCDEKGFLPRFCIASSFNAPVRNAPEFTSYDYRGAWGMDVEIVKEEGE